MYRNRQDQRIDTMHWHVYHGGNGAKWTPNKNQSIWCAYILHVQSIRGDEDFTPCITLLLANEKVK